MQVPDQMEISSVMKNMFPPQERKAVIARVKVVGAVAPEDPMPAIQEVMPAHQNLHLEVSPEVSRDHLVLQVEALIQVDQVEVRDGLLRREFLHKNNIKKYLL